MKIELSTPELESLVIAVTSRIETLTSIRDALPVNSQRRRILTQLIQSDTSLQSRLFSELSKDYLRG